jgi:uncharacterized protein (DUF934 family)
MPLIKNEAVAADPWRHVDAETPLPEAGDVVLPLARLIKDWDQLTTRDGRLGALIANTDKLEALQDMLTRLALIVLAFPAFNDGRAYSLARRLREMGYRGELRATGNVLPDQLQFMRQVGFDAFEVTERFSTETWLKASRQMSLAYQRGLYRPAGETEVWSERHREAAPWFEQPFAG